MFLKNSFVSFSFFSFSEHLHLCGIRTLMGVIPFLLVEKALFLDFGNGSVIGNVSETVSNNRKHPLKKGLKAGVVGNCQF